MKSPRKIPISFMTWNIYFGTVFTPLLAASPPEIPQTVTEVYRLFLATNFPERAKAIARQIVSKSPDFIGLQEAAVWELIPPNGEPVVFDFVSILLRELKLRGAKYEVAAQVRNLSVELPDSSGNLVRFTDRNVTLKRKTRKFKIVRKQEANFQTNLQVELAGQPFTVLQGFTAIDVRVRGRTFRLVNTHLDPGSPLVNAAQGNELLAGPAATNLPVVMLGDFNSNADGTGTPTYGNLIAAGFTDTWTQVGEGNGFTCCQQDPGLLNAFSTLIRRIDLILFKERKDWKAARADVVGESQRDRTPTRLWPSDHAGVSAILKLRCRKKVRLKLKRSRN